MTRLLLGDVQFPSAIIMRAAQTPPKGTIYTASLRGGARTAFGQCAHVRCVPILTATCVCVNAFWQVYWEIAMGPNRGRRRLSTMS